ncbi:hypothetical protein F4810DRAFT_661484 [Camillea tinctor]|nr:hypothetical protein F4810DRAFT_661484 [Camillea tinctor]
MENKKLSSLIGRLPYPCRMYSPLHRSTFVWVANFCICTAFFFLILYFLFFFLFEVLWAPSLPLLLTQACNKWLGIISFCFFPSFEGRGVLVCVSFGFLGLETDLVLVGKNEERVIFRQFIRLLYRVWYVAPFAPMKYMRRRV